MSDALSIIADLAAAGVSPELIGRVAMAIASAQATQSPAPASPSAPSKGAQRMARYRQRRVDLGLEAVFRPELFADELMLRDGPNCGYCGDPKVKATDHMVPTSRGGLDDLDNLIRCCVACNSRKRDMTPAEAGFLFASEGARSAHVRYLCANPLDAHGAQYRAQSAHHVEQIAQNSEYAPLQTAHTGAHVPLPGLDISPLDPPSLLPEPLNPPPYNPPSNHQTGVREEFDLTPPVAKQKTVKAPKVPAAPKTGRRLSPEWEPSDEDRAYAASLGFSDSRIDMVALDFRDYWIAKTGNATKLDWAATWRTWCRKDLERKGNGNGQSPNRTSTAQWRQTERLDDLRTMRDAGLEAIERRRLERERSGG